MFWYLPCLLRPKTLLIFLFVGASNRLDARWQRQAYWNTRNHERVTKWYNKYQKVLLAVGGECQLSTSPKLVWIAMRPHCFPADAGLQLPKPLVHCFWCFCLIRFCNSDTNYTDSISWYTISNYWNIGILPILSLFLFLLLDGKPKSRSISIPCNLQSLLWMVLSGCTWSGFEWIITWLSQPSD
jgi:hypothetical protein